MAIIAGCSLVLLLSLAALYKNLAPISRCAKVTVSATAVEAYLGTENDSSSISSIQETEL